MDLVGKTRRDNCPVTVDTTVRRFDHGEKEDRV